MRLLERFKYSLASASIDSKMQLEFDGAANIGGKCGGSCVCLYCGFFVFVCNILLLAEQDGCAGELELLVISMAVLFLARIS